MRVSWRVRIQGQVQGVGFRPFAYSLAQKYGVRGWVNNSAQGVNLVVEGEEETLAIFMQSLEADLPWPGQIQNLQVEAVPCQGFTDFKIRASEAGAKTALILPDLATCRDCWAEIFDPGDRRYRYPFTNCTHCGPRYSIIAGLPYDRSQTSMQGFRLCAECQREYDDPGDRRFHAQPNACHRCGPQVQLWDAGGQVLASREAALSQTVGWLQEGKIVAVKGVGGFQLWVDATQAEAVQELRRRKNRPHKPFAVMFPQLASVAACCYCDAMEQKYLTSPQAPILLLRQRANFLLAANLAPGNLELGAMLPSMPLHGLLLEALQKPVVATSGNRSGEPICIDNQEALEHLSAIADYFLVHDRPILRAVDDSVGRVIEGQLQLLRRARGYAPLPLGRATQGPPVLAVGGQLKNTVALALGESIYLSQHIGDLENSRAVQGFEQTLASLSQLYDFAPQAIVQDLHPDYFTSQYAWTQTQPQLAVQHHQAHILAVVAEHRLQPPLLGIAWDGSGLGTDGTLWGGEFFDWNHSGWQRLAHLRPFPLLGGTQAILEPPRVALALLKVAGLSPLPPSLTAYFSSARLTQLETLYSQAINAPLTSSMGRLFDGVAALLGLVTKISFEGQGAIALESQTAEVETADFYPFRLEAVSPQIIDWQPLLANLLGDLSRSVPSTIIATKFHNTLVEIICCLCNRQGLEQVLLTGGCFQNRYLLTRAITRLRGEGFRVYWSQQFPPNDGALALGQIWAWDVMGQGLLRQERENGFQEPTHPQ